MAAPIEIRLDELRQLFDALDPAPFRERDLDPRADEFIVESARELPKAVPLALVVHVAHAAPDATEVAELAPSVQQHYRRRAQIEWRRLRELFRVGRWSLAIGLAFVAAALAFGEWMAAFVLPKTYARVAYDSLVIGAWVALWRPLEIFLYDWWPIRAEARLYERLAAMPVALAAG
ncbi:MAG: hypothetical protein ACK5TK_02340 [Betaproteobacteria bacterium]